MRAEHTTYRDGDTALEGYVSFDNSTPAKRPAVLVFHAWAGQDEFACARADALAALGYVGLAVDMYGSGKRGTTPAENSKLMQPFLDDRAMLRRRAVAAIECVKALPNVDATHLACIGFCFGGLCALDVARAGVPGMRGAVSLHGLFAAPTGVSIAQPMHTKVLALHGWNDPMVKPDAVLAFAREMSGQGADWELDAYGHVGHAFTNPQANDAKGGMQFSPVVNRRAFRATEEFLDEVFSARYESVVPRCPWPA
jgi:dienelactone hydrolase